jgi:hypothetical protein
VPLRGHTPGSLDTAGCDHFFCRYELPLHGWHSQHDRERATASTGVESIWSAEGDDWRDQPAVFPDHAEALQWRSSDDPSLHEPLAVPSSAAPAPHAARSDGPTRSGEASGAPPSRGVVALAPRTGGPAGSGKRVKSGALMSSTVRAGSSHGSVRGGGADPAPVLSMASSLKVCTA